jgi:signal transduction histidine kinase
VPVVGDRRALHQVSMNLLLNACEATPKGGRIVVQCGLWQPASDARPLARLRFTDTGSGIPAEHVPRVFDPFFTTKRTGTGLGLPICRDIVARHGGTLRLDSAEGHGTTATVLMPLRTPDHGSSPPD